MESMGYEVVVKETRIDGIYVVRRFVGQLTRVSLPIASREDC